MRGVIAAAPPFVLAMPVTIIRLIVLPDIALWLPNVLE